MIRHRRRQRRKDNVKRTMGLLGISMVLLIVTAAVIFPLKSKAKKDVAINSNFAAGQIAAVKAALGVGQNNTSDKKLSGSIKKTGNMVQKAAGDTVDKSKKAAAKKAEEERSRVEEERRQNEAKRKKGEQANHQGKKDGKVSVPAVKIDTSRPVVALTFDDGPHSKYTNRILDCLEKYNARATFFVLGSRVKGHEDTLKRVINGGNEVGSHTYSHKDLRKLSGSELDMELNETTRLLQNWVNYTPRLLRPPYGAFNHTVSAASKMPFVLWSVDTEDWKSRNSAAVTQRALSGIKSGDIVLFHDIYGSTAEAIERIVPELAEKGYQFVTVSQLAQYKGTAMQNGIKYFSFH